MRTDALRTGGGGGGESFGGPASSPPTLPGLVGGGRPAEDGEDRLVLLLFWYLSYPGLENDGLCLCPPLGCLRGGGGAGAERLRRMLDDRDLCDSRDERGDVVAPSETGTAVLLSLLPCALLCRLGGGAGFRCTDVAVGGFCTGVEDEWLAPGGVGGLGGGTRSASGSMSSSGILPAASLSKMLSLASSSVRSAGGGGRGLLTSVGLEEDEDGRPGEVGEVPVVYPPEDVRRSSTGGADASLSFVSVLISRPCLVAGGGGGFLRDPDRWGLGAGNKLRLSSSPSGSDIS